jgi:hypothetical protein
VPRLLAAAESVRSQMPEDQQRDKRRAELTRVSARTGVSDVVEGGGLFSSRLLSLEFNLGTPPRTEAR